MLTGQLSICRKDLKITKHIQEEELYEEKNKSITEQHYKVISVHVHNEKAHSL